MSRLFDFVTHTAVRPTSVRRLYTATTDRTIAIVVDNQLPTRLSAKANLMRCRCPLLGPSRHFACARRSMTRPAGMAVGADPRVGMPPSVCIS
jgi:hypothetical protein